MHNARTRPEVDALQVSPEFANSGVTDEKAAIVQDLARRVAEGLRVYPHFVVLTGLAPTENRALTVAVGRAIAGMDPADPVLTPDGRIKVSFTRVQIDPEKVGSENAVTRYSRTNKPLEMHTDSSYQARPHEFVAFQMVRADPDGGDTLLVPVEHVVDALGPEMVATLKQAPIPFGRGDFPILWDRNGSSNIRYYRSQIDTARQDGDRLTRRDLSCMAALDEALQRPDNQFQFHLRAGETLFLHNTKVLHGRTGFASSSTRLMYRIRINAGCLG